MLKKVKMALLYVSILTLLGCAIHYKYSVSEIRQSQPRLNGSTDVLNVQQRYRSKESSKNVTEGFHVILTFRLLNTTKEKENARMKEYIDCLKSFLNNSHVKQVHLMYDSPELSRYIQEKAGAHPKLMLHRVDSPDVVLTLHQFAFTHLQGEVVVITQADLMLGEGFEKVNRSTLSKNRLLYGLSRQGTCKNEWNQCTKYQGSHDMFVFVPEGSLTESARESLSHHVYYYGTENVVLHVYKNILKYRILNPCHVLRIYHHHCSGFRGYPTQQKRINTKKSVTSSPTSKLV